MHRVQMVHGVQVVVYGAHGETGPQVCNTSHKCATPVAGVQHQAHLCYTSRTWDPHLSVTHDFGRSGIKVLAALNPVDPLQICYV